MWWNPLFGLYSTLVEQFVPPATQLVYPGPATQADHTLRNDGSCSKTAEYAAHVRLISTHEWNLDTFDHENVLICLNPNMAGVTS